MLRTRSYFSHGPCGTFWGGGPKRQLSKCEREDLRLKAEAEKKEQAAAAESERARVAGAAYA